MNTGRQPGLQVSQGMEQGLLCWSMYVWKQVLACRYVVYLESMAWSTNGRHKFSCGSVVISNKMGYYEFFTRALKPGVHYVEVDPNNLCDDLVSKVSDPIPAKPGYAIRPAGLLYTASPQATCFASARWTGTLTISGSWCRTTQ